MKTRISLALLLLAVTPTLYATKEDQCKDHDYISNSSSYDSYKETVDLSVGVVEIQRKYAPLTGDEASIPRLDREIACKKADALDELVTAMSKAITNKRFLDKTRTRLCHLDKFDLELLKNRKTEFELELRQAERRCRQ